MSPANWSPRTKKMYSACSAAPWIQAAPPKPRYRTGGSFCSSRMGSSTMASVNSSGSGPSQPLVWILHRSDMPSAARMSNTQLSGKPSNCGSPSRQRPKRAARNSSMSDSARLAPKDLRTMAPSWSSHAMSPCSTPSRLSQKRYSACGGGSRASTLGARPAASNLRRPSWGLSFGVSTMTSVALSSMYAFGAVRHFRPSPSRSRMNSNVQPSCLGSSSTHVPTKPRLMPSGLASSTGASSATMSSVFGTTGGPPAEGAVRC
mmetsp:Transcript_35982/g.100578  ORF Transcript_35982/g.100578 Transcript_35982/m.100578 type:complete len:261 (-) Transcript_35982:82-864(-)